MYTPSPKQSLDARTPAIPGDFIGMLADFKVKQSREAAMRALSAQAGQPMPTVKDQVEGENLNSARQEIAQKLGLPGLQQAQAQPAQPRGQTPQAAPGQAPQPQGAPQAMAAGGLTKLGSNLPKSYAGGGIIAFDEGGPAKNDPSAWRLLVPAALGGSAAAMSQLTKLAPQLGYASVGELLKDVGAAPELAKLKNAVPTMPKGALKGLGVVGALGGTAAAVAGTPTEDYRKRFGMETDDPSFLGDVGVRALGAASDLGDIATMGYASKYFRDKQAPDAPAPTPVPVKAEPRVIYDQPPTPTGGIDKLPGAASARSSVRTATRGTAPSEAPVVAAPAPVAPADDSLESVITKAAMKAATLDPETGRAATDAAYRQTFGAKADAYEAAQRASLAKLQAEQAAEKGSRRTGLAGLVDSLAMGAAMGHGNFGRSLAFSNIADEKRRQGYAAADQGYAKANMDAEAGILKPGMEGALAQFGAGNKEVESRRALQGHGITSGAGILNNRETNKTHVQTNAASNATTLEAARIQASSHYASAIAAADRAEKATDAREKAALIRAEVDSLKALLATNKGLIDSAVKDPANFALSKEDADKARAEIAWATAKIKQRLGAGGDAALIPESSSATLTPAQEAKFNKMMGK